MGSVRRGFYLISLGLWGFLAVFLLWLPVSASAAPVTYETTRVGNGSYAPNGVTTPITVNVKGPGVSKYHQIVPVATKETIGRLGRSMIRGGGVGLAVNAVVSGLGYLIDQATGEIKKVERETVFIPGQLGGLKVREECGWAPLSECGAALALDYVVIKSHPALGSSKLVNGWSCLEGYISYATEQHIAKCYADAAFEEIEHIIDLSPEDYQRIDNQLNTALSIAEKTAILKNALSLATPSGRLDTDNHPYSSITSNPKLNELFNVWPEIGEAYRALLNAQVAAYLKSINPDYQLSPEDQAIVDNALDGPPLPPPSDLKLDFELPAFCEWASFICEPFVGGEHPEVPKLDLEVQDYDSGLPTSAACPAPVSVELSIFGTHELSYQPICDFAGMIRIPVIAISYLIAGFIVVGVRR